MISRKSCPDCGSIYVIRRVRAGGYRCGRCHLIFENPKMIEQKTPATKSLTIRLEDMPSKRRRKACPDCGSLQVYHRSSTHDYRCMKCGNVMEPIIVLSRSYRNPSLSEERLEHIRQLKKENPEASRKQLAMMAFDSEYAVTVALKNYDPEQVPAL